jgi:hypothetical protein
MQNNQDLALVNLRNRNLRNEIFETFDDLKEGNISLAEAKQFAHKAQLKLNEIKADKAAIIESIETTVENIDALEAEYRSVISNEEPQN